MTEWDKNSGADYLVCKWTVSFKKLIAVRKMKILLMIESKLIHG
jgi:hypothetical protein